MERRKGKVNFQQSAGGLATGISSFYKTYESIWIGWPGIDSDKIEKSKEEIRKKLISEFNCHPVFLPRRDFDNYYSGFCNNTIWPLFHYFPQHTAYKENFWKSYKRINELFCEDVLTIAKEEDIIWIHDYQLMLLPKLLREKLPNATIGFFLYVSFPPFELFRRLP
jgi:trehalose 6-phosphate synthase/phosphatase